MSSVAPNAAIAQMSMVARASIEQFSLEPVHESCYGVVMCGRIEVIMEYLTGWAVLAHSPVQPSNEKEDATLQVEP